MAAYFKELKSNLLSNIVFLNLLIYHTSLKQSILCRAAPPAINGEITVNQLNKTIINKIKIIDFHFSFQNPFLFLPFKRLYIYKIFNILRDIIFYFVIYNFFVCIKQFSILLFLTNYKIRLMHECSALNFYSCINTGEPAAVFGLFLRIKVVELMAPESAAAGSLGVWVSKVSKVGWNDVAWMPGCMGEKIKGRRIEGEKDRK